MLMLHFDCWSLSGTCRAFHSSIFICCFDQICELNLVDHVSPSKWSKLFLCSKTKNYNIMIHNFMTLIGILLTNVNNLSMNERHGMDGHMPLCCCDWILLAGTPSTNHLSMQIISSEWITCTLDGNERQHVLWWASPKANFVSIVDREGDFCSWVWLQQLPNLWNI